MGRKSREKRVRRQRKAVTDSLRVNAPHPVKEVDADFARQRANFERWLCGYNAEDVCLSLCISDLWLPNISSQVKHTFAFGVIASMAPVRFTAARRIETYAEFCEFIEQIYTRLPSFPMLEDFVPEGDWGEIRIESEGSLLRSFYGGAVERIPDFVTAFLLLQNANPAARRDIHAAIAIQDHVISNVDRSLIGIANSIEPGHLEVPAEPFWSACRTALLSVSDSQEVIQLDTALVTSLGQFTPPSSWSQFGDGVISGSALPFFLLDVGPRRLPISLRNACAMVIQLWADRSKKEPNSLVWAASENIGELLCERFNRDCLVPGPLHLLGRAERLPYTFAAAMMGTRRLYLIVALTEESVQRLPTIETAINRLLLSKEWVLWPDGAAHGVQFRRGDGLLPSVGEVVLIAVLARVTTEPGVLKLPKTSARVLPLPDFVTVFDSIVDIDELDRFWAFCDNNSKVGALAGLVDRFAAFRDSHALLVDGAVSPTLIALDPLWGSKWRHRQLEKFWANAPPLFPWGKSASWKTTRDQDGLYVLIGKTARTVSWCAVLGRCVVHVVFQVEGGLEIEDGRMLELMVHCLADSLLQRMVLIEALPLLQQRLIVTTCHAHRDMLTTLDDDNDELDERPLFSEWSVSATPEPGLRARVNVNLKRVQQRITGAEDARFEAEAVLAWIDGLNVTLGIASIPDDTRASIIATGNRRPRFTAKTLVREVDVPQFATPAIPGPEHYKIARRDLAIVFNTLNAKAGKYELRAGPVCLDSKSVRISEALRWSCRE